MALDLGRIKDLGGMINDLLGTAGQAANSFANIVGNHQKPKETTTSTPTLTPAAPAAAMSLPIVPIGLGLLGLAVLLFMKRK